MTEWRFWADRSVSVDDGNLTYLPLVGGDNNPNSSATEAETQLKSYVAYTFSDLRVRLSTHSGPGVTFALRDDGSSSSTLTVSLTGTTWIDDLTGSDTVVANSLMNWIADQSAGMHGDTFTVDDSAVTYAHASTKAPIFAFIHGNSLPADRWGVFGTSGTWRTNEIEARTHFYRAQALSNLHVYVSAVSSITADIAISKNGTKSTTVVVAITGTGEFEDATGSESYTDSDDGSFYFDIASGSATLQVTQVQADSDESIAGYGNSTGSPTTRQFYSPSGESIGTTAKDEYDMYIGSVTAANLQCYISSAGSGTRDVTLRIGATDSTTVTINITGTGHFEDITGTETLVDADSLTFSMASTGTGASGRFIAVEVPWSAVGGVTRRIFIT